MSTADHRRDMIIAPVLKYLSVYAPLKLHK